MAQKRGKQERGQGDYTNRWHNATSQRSQPHPLPPRSSNTSHDINATSPAISSDFRSQPFGLNTSVIIRRQSVVILKRKLKREMPPPIPVPCRPGLHLGRAYRLTTASTEDTGGGIPGSSSECAYSTSPPSRSNTKVPPSRSTPSWYCRRRAK